MSPRRKNRFITRAAARVTSPFIAVLLLPLAAAVWAAGWSVIRSLRLPWESLWPVAAGVGAYVFFQALFSKPMGLYVFGHELTHALAAWLSGYRVKSLKVSAAGGEVVTSDTNLFVALAPYCVPLYTLFVVAAYALARGSAGPAAPPAWCAFAVGATFSFHVALTVHALRQRQPDLEHGGVFLSLVIILLSNGVSLALLAKLLYPDQVSLEFFARRWWALTLGALQSAWGAALWARSRLP